jgi:hypothetical protein
MADQRREPKRTRTTRAQRARIVERFYRSGLTQVAFARRRGLSAWTLNRWLAEAKRGWKPASPPMVFGELQLAPMSLPESSSGWAVELLGPNGVRIRLGQGLAVRDLARLLRGASRGC